MQLRSEPLDAVEQQQSSLATQRKPRYSEERRRIRAVAKNAYGRAARSRRGLAYFAGMSQTEIAQKLSQPLGTVKTRVRAGMMKLREGVTTARGAAIMKVHTAVNDEVRDQIILYSLNALDPAGGRQNSRLT